MCRIYTYLQLFLSLSSYPYFRKIRHEALALRCCDPFVCRQFGTVYFAHVAAHRPRGTPHACSSFWKGPSSARYSKQRPVRARICHREWWKITTSSSTRLSLYWANKEPDGVPRSHQHLSRTGECRQFIKVRCNTPRGAGVLEERAPSIYRPKDWNSCNCNFILASQGKQPGGSTRDPVQIEKQLK